MKQRPCDRLAPPFVPPGPGPPGKISIPCSVKRASSGVAAKLSAGTVPRCPLPGTVRQLLRENRELRRELDALRKNPAPASRRPAAKLPPLEQLESAVRGLDPARLVKKPGEALSTVQRSLQGVWHDIEPEASPGELRSLVVQTMRLSLELWLKSTRTSKAELARRSGQWSVYVNPDGWERTQGLDRYLDIVTLPKNPRLKKVLFTGDFVIGSCHKAHPQYQRLQDALARLRTLHKNVSDRGS